MPSQILVLDKLHAIKYTVGMPKNELTPKVFEAKKADYQEALDERRTIIKQQSAAGWKQHEIAAYWGLDITRVNKIINEGKTKEE